MPETDLRELFARYLSGETNELETKQVMEQIATGTYEEELVSWTAAYWAQLEQADDRFTGEKGLLMLQKILTPSMATAREAFVVPLNQTSRLRKWGWIAVAALLIVAAGIYLFEHTRKAVPVNTITAADIAPGKEGAMLTLADGSTILLDTIRHGTVSLQGGITAKIVDGSLIYEGNGTEQVYNTMHTPKGRQFHMTLSDGTQVWLNAGSSIRFPNLFVGDNREVEMTGEAYFEVAHDAKRSFRVIVDRRAELRVMGTHFNVNAYPNEPHITTTLLEGAVSIGYKSAVQGERALQEVILKPGQQAQLSQSGSAPIHLLAADTDKVMAWKNGFFYFNGVQLGEAMRQLERWYDIEVIYPKGIPDVTFRGEMTRDVTLQDVLDGLSSMHIHFRMEGRQLIVFP